MRLRKLEVTEIEASAVGLQAITIDELPRTIALVGKNGSGKTRWLNLLQSKINSYSDIYSLNAFLSDVPQAINLDIETNNREIREYFQVLISSKLQANNGLNSQNNHIVRRRLRVLEAEIETNPKLRIEFIRLKQSFESKLANLSPQFISSSVIRIRDSDVQLVLEKLKQNPTNVIPLEDIIDSINKSLQYDIIQSIQKTGFQYVEKLAHKLVLAQQEALNDQGDLEKSTSYSQYRILREMVGRFMHKKLVYGKSSVSHKYTDDGITSHFKGHWILNDTAFDYSKLSDGEKVLFSYSLLFFAIEMNSQVRLRDSIIIIDEPELHLHPEAEISIVKAIQGITAKTGQLIIATHSLPILATLDVNSIFPVVSGVLEVPSRQAPAKAIAELMGLDEHISRLHDFVGRLDEWAFSAFSEQCLRQPNVFATAKSNDPEVNLLARALERNQPNTRVLDYGAGRGRVIEALRRDYDYSALIDAFEPNVKLHGDLLKHGAERVYSELSQLAEGDYDVIFICGVLHEIDISEWAGVFQAFSKSLRMHGVIVIIEDDFIPVGECAHDSGFLVLDEESIARMLRATNIETLCHNEEKYADRIRCWVIGRNDFHIPSKYDLKAALDIRKINVRDEMKNLLLLTRAVGYDLKMGRRSAFLAHQYLNLDLAIEKLGP